MRVDVPEPWKKSRHESSAYFCGWRDAAVHIIRRIVPILLRTEQYRHMTIDEAHRHLRREILDE